MKGYIKLSERTEQDAKDYYGSMNDKERQVAVQKMLLREGFKAREVAIKKGIKLKAPFI